MKLTDKERNTCAALLCRWAARDNELMASDYYGSSQYYNLMGALTALRTLGLMAETVLSDAPAPGGYYNFGKIMLDGMVYDVPEPKEEMENEDADDPPAQRAAAARWAKARRLALAVNGTIGAVGVGLVVGSGLPAALCLTPWDWPLTLAGAVLAGAACVVECALTDRYTRP